VVFSRYSGFLHQKSESHDIAEIFLKMASNTNPKDKKIIKTNKAK